jgi:hypothetical protein
VAPLRNAFEVSVLRRHVKQRCPVIVTRVHVRARPQALALANKRPVEQWRRARGLSRILGLDASRKRRLKRLRVAARSRSDDTRCAVHVAHSRFKRREEKMALQ